MQFGTVPRRWLICTENALGCLPDVLFLGKKIRKLQDWTGKPTVPIDLSSIQWEFQDPKMEVLYHIRPYFVGIFSYIGLENMSYIW